MANAFHGPTYVIAGIVVVALAALIAVRVRRGRRDHGASRGGSAPGPADPGPDERAATPHRYQATRPGDGGSLP